MGAPGRGVAGLFFEPSVLRGRRRDDALEERLYGPKSVKRAGRPLPDPAYLHVELHRPASSSTSNTSEQHPNGFRYTAFCRHYNEWHGGLAPYSSSFEYTTFAVSRPAAMVASSSGVNSRNLAMNESKSFAMKYGSGGSTSRLK